ncbi:MFS transporter [Rufibacter hautae]|uniref:MFS transporter n=1 Tax=Rufibacter hautae TaxID=2595005 RepID=A0A5B6TIN1_9BACT|nr:MFS transporter [Rufibacter hautae]KAA3439229.1 MFS transporter [Rufibacter hautae]
MLPSVQENAPVRYFTFFYLYFMQGVPSGFALTALANFLTGQNVSPAAIGAFASAVGIPWVVQLGWGPLIDRFSSSSEGPYKRWVVFTQLLAFGASLLLLIVKEPSQQMGLLAALFFTHSLFASVQDASVDAMAISLVEDREKGRVNGFMRGGLLLGISFGAAGLSYLLHAYGFAVATGAMSAVLLLFTLLFMATPLYSQKAPGPTLQVQPGSTPAFRLVFTRLLRRLLGRESISVFGLVFLSYLCFSLFARSLSFHLIKSLGWSDQQLSLFQGSWGAAITLAVVLGGGYLADRVHLKRMYYITITVLAVFLVLFNGYLLGHSGEGWVKSGLVFWGLADPLFSVSSFPLLMAICDKRIAGSQFTAYMALINLSDVIGSFLCGWLLQVIFPPVIGLTAGFLLLVVVVSQLLVQVRKPTQTLESG